MPIDMTLPLGVRTLTTVEADRLRQQYPDLPPSPERCITCRGAKKFTWWDDPASPERMAVEYECPCRDQWVLHRYLLHSGVNLLYQQLSWADMHMVEGEGLEAIRHYMDLHERYVANGFGVILHGEKGTGKTGLSALLLKYLIGQGHDSYFTTFAQLLSFLKGTFRDNDETTWFHRRVRNAGVLVIDDLGREHFQRRFLSTEQRVALGTDSGIRENPTAMAESTLEEIVRHRVASLRPTIITTNLDPVKVEELYGSNLLSLLRERSTTCRFEGTDRRDTVRMRMHDEVEAGLTRPLVLG